MSASNDRKKRMEARQAGLDRKTNMSVEEIKKQHQSGHRCMQYSGIPCSHTDRRDRELQTYDGLRCGIQDGIYVRW